MCDESCSSSESSVWLDPEECSPQKSCGGFKPQVLDHLPYGAIPIDQFEACFSPSPCGTPCDPPRRKGGSNNLDLTVYLSNVENVVGQTSGLDNGQIMIKLRRRNQTVVFGWESFTCQLSANGIRAIPINAQFGNLPFSEIRIPIQVEVNGNLHTGFFSIDPTKKVEVFKFHLDIKNEISTKKHDSIKIFGSSATWITC